MKNTKKGFTLTEVLIVTAIIVILGGAAVAGIAVSIQNTKERGEAFAQSQGENWESEAVLEVKKTKVGLGVEQIYEASADTPAPDNGSTSDDKDLESTPTDAPADTPASTPADTPATTPGSGSTGGGSGSTGTGTGNTGSTGTGTGSTGTGTGTGSTGTGTGSGSGSGSTSSSVAVTFSGNTVERGTKGNGVMSVTQNSDGSTTLGLLYNQWQDGSVQVWKNSDGTYDIQGLNNGGDVIGNAINSTGTSPNWEKINAKVKYTLSPDEVSALESVYGINFE